MPRKKRLPYSLWSEKQKQMHRERHRRWKQRHKDKVAEQKRRYYLRHKEKLLEKMKRYRQEHKEEVNRRVSDYQKSHRKERNVEALARRKIQLADSCEICGSKEKLERHHPDYGNPLKIKTLCKKCHIRIHRRSLLVGD